MVISFQPFRKEFLLITNLPRQECAAYCGHHRKHMLITISLSLRQSQIYLRNHLYLCNRPSSTVVMCNTDMNKQGGTQPPFITLLCTLGIGNSTIILLTLVIHRLTEE